MKKIFGLVLLAALYYAHGYYVFGENHLNAWFAERNEALIEDQDGLCDVYSADVQFSFTQKTPDGELLQEGGYNKLCQTVTGGGGDRAMSISALQAAGASINIYTRVISVDRAEFPWLQATVKANQATRITQGRTPPIFEEGDATLLIERTYRGLKIKRLTGTSELRILEDTVPEPAEEAS